MTTDLHAQVGWSPPPPVGTGSGSAPGFMPQDGQPPPNSQLVLGHPRGRPPWHAIPAAAGAGIPGWRARLTRRPLLGTHKGHRCQEGIQIWPGDYARRRAGLTVLLGSSSQLPVSSRRAAGGSSWSARSRAAARTNELDAGKRRKIIEGEEGFGRGWIIRGRVRVPGAGWRSGLTSTHPAPRQCAGGCHDHVSGTGLLSHVIERGAGAGSCRRSELTRGLATLRLTAAAAACWHRRVPSRTAGARRGSPACGRSRWWRSSSLAVWRWPRSWR